MPENCVHGPCGMSILCSFRAATRSLAHASRYRHLLVSSYSARIDSPKLCRKTDTFSSILSLIAVTTNSSDWDSDTMVGGGDSTTKFVRGRTLSCLNGVEVCSSVLKPMFAAIEGIKLV